MSGKMRTFENPSKSIANKVKPRNYLVPEFKKNKQTYVDYDIDTDKDFRGKEPQDYTPEEWFFSDHLEEDPFDRSPKFEIDEIFNPKLEFSEVFGPQFMSADVHPKLKVNQPDDEYEREADMAADQVMRMEDSDIQRQGIDEEKEDEINPVVQRQEEEKEEEELIATKKKDNETILDPVTEKKIQNLGSGKSLSESEKEFFEPRFGRDFSDVKIHTDSEAGQLAEDINARAFAKGKDIVLGEGEYNTSSFEGKRLMAHELDHVVQGTKNNVIQKKIYRKKSLPIKFADKLDYDKIAKMINEGVKNIGTTEYLVYAALQRLKRDTEAISRLESKYYELYKVTLIDTLKSDFSGSELEYSLQLINKGSSSAKEKIDKIPTDRAEWINTLTRLHEALEGSSSYEVIFSILISFNRNPSLIDSVKDNYKIIYGENLRDKIIKKLRGWKEDYALYLMGEQPLFDKDKEAEKGARDILNYIKEVAQERAKKQQYISPSSLFYKRLKDFYLKDYFRNSTKSEGEKSVKKIGRPMEGRRDLLNPDIIDVKPEKGAWRPAKNRWEEGAIVFWNQQKLPVLPAELKDLSMFKHINKLPTDLSAATDILIDENVKKLSYLDIPFLLGKINPGTGNIMIDVIGGGKNISQLMHWATGVKYAKEDMKALRELFLLYELWHLEGWDVFGQDALNDMIAEEQGRLLGTELLKGGKGELKRSSDLLSFLNKSYRQARAWVGALLRLRKEELDNWILAKQQKVATMHWDENEQYNIWPSLTIYQMIADGETIEDIKKSYLVESQIEIYRLLYEANEWEKINGKIEITILEREVIEGKLNAILKVFALSKSASTGAKIDAYKA